MRHADGGPAAGFAPVNLLGEEEVGADTPPDEQRFAGAVSVGRQTGDYMVALIWATVIGLMLWYVYYSE